MHVKKTKHHRKCLKNGGDNSPRNIVKVSDKRHRCYHYLFGHMTPEKVAEELSRVWVDPDYKIIAVNRNTGLTVKEVLSFKEEVQQTA